MSNWNRKYKKESCRTLLGFLRCLSGEEIQVDLYGGTMLIGKLVDIDVNHQLHLSSVTMSSPLNKFVTFQRLCIRYKNVRFIRVPDRIDVIETIRQDLRQMNPKASEIVGGGQKKRTIRKGREYEKNLPVLRAEDH